MNQKPSSNEELFDWVDALDNLIFFNGKEDASLLIKQFVKYAQNKGLLDGSYAEYPFENSILKEEQHDYPGDLELEKTIRHYIRWNALVTVLKANKEDDLGGHISTYSSASILYETGFNHFFRGYEDGLGDLIYYQGHSSPGIYARSFIEGRFKQENLKNFRREIDGKGLSSYPHPWLMKDYWQFPTVSMGLGPLMAIYQAHIQKYLTQRGLLEETNNRKVWVFCGDGEMDEPESLGAISLAAREKLNNLIFVINCNLQRLDGPVRGNSRIITELGSIFAAAGWNVINLIWGRRWDELLEKDTSGALRWVMNNTVDGEYQNFKAKGGAYTRKHFFGKHPDALKLVENMTDEEIEELNRGGHDPIKVFNAYKKAVESDKPSVILAFTIKGYGIGSRQADNMTHQVKKLSIENLKSFKDKFNLPIKDSELVDPPFLHFNKGSKESEYIKKTRKALGGYIPFRPNESFKLIPENNHFDIHDKKTEREMSTTMVFVKIITSLLRDKNIGKNIVPIVPDEARTFGMDGLFRQFGIYSSEGQKYTPEDADKVMWYRESQDGVMLEEGINEAGAFSAWIALATSYSSNRLPMIPFYIYYSMFGFQRVHDLAWAAGDARARGFLLGATSGRTTLNGEGLQHQDGHSHLLAQTIPNCKSYDPCFDYELATIIKHGIDDMYTKNNDNYYYLTLMNENYLHPERPKNLKDSEIMQGAYLFKTEKEADVRLLASGLTLRFAIEAADKLLEFGIKADIWSVTSFNELARGGIVSDQQNMSGNKSISYVENCFASAMPTVAVSEYQKLYSEQIRKWVNGNYICLGTDGFGRSDTREKLREFFEIDANHIAYNALIACGLKDEANTFKNKYKVKINENNPFTR